MHGPCQTDGVVDEGPEGAVMPRLPWGFPPGLASCHRGLWDSPHPPPLADKCVPHDPATSGGGCWPVPDRGM
jgi:hypothetical protein